MVSTIGIISGSGPEAGLDLHQKILWAHRKLLGPSYGGDVDAPRVISISEPELGRSMELDLNAEAVWSALHSTAAQLAPQVDVYGIACNTLNVFCDDIGRDPALGWVVSVQDAVAEALRATQTGRFGLLGSRPVAELGPWSAYRELTHEFDVLTPQDPEPLQQLIYDIKLCGGRNASLDERLTRVIAQLQTPVVLLACTELPMLNPSVGDITLLDATTVLAERLVADAMAVQHH